MAVYDYTAGADSRNGAVLDLRERRRLETRREINLAALDLFEQKGVVGTTVDEIASAAGVSASTFFRQFKTKEESVLSVDLNLYTEIEAWMLVTEPSHIDLPGIESIYERAILAFVRAPVSYKSRVLRTRRLIIGDTYLRAAAIALDAAAVSHLVTRLMGKFGDCESSTFTKMLVECASATFRISFDEWATHADAGADVDLFEIYRAARVQLRRIVVPPSGE